jgi:DNA topoisomerase VI subunit B
MIALGKFGVGLSTCLLYSLIKTNEPMRIVSKRMSQSESTVADFILNPRRQPSLSQEMKIILPITAPSCEYLFVIIK